jgi:subtilisin family serine protease
MSDAANVMCVGASDRGARYPSSNFGRPFVDVTAPGANIGTFGPLGATVASGTSLAAAMITGQAAQLFRNAASWSPTAASSLILRSAAGTRSS